MEERTINKMTDEQSREEIMRKGARENLEDRLNQDLVGSNRVLNPQATFKYGQLGVQSAQIAHEKLVRGEDVRKLMEREYQLKLRKKDMLGLSGEPNYPTIYELTEKRAEILEQSKEMLPLRELAEIVYSVADGFEFDLPGELENYTAQELSFKKAQNEGELSEQEEDALSAYDLLSQAYDLGISLRTSRSNYFEGLNQAGRQIAGRYQPSEPGENDRE